MSDVWFPASTMMIATVAMIITRASAWNPANHAAARRAPGPPQTRMSRYIGTRSRPQNATNSTKSDAQSTPFTRRLEQQDQDHVEANAFVDLPGVEDRAPEDGGGDHEQRERHPVGGEVVVRLEEEVPEPRVVLLVRGRQPATLSEPDLPEDGEERRDEEAQSGAGERDGPAPAPAAPHRARAGTIATIAKSIGGQTIDERITFMPCAPRDGRLQPALTATRARAMTHEPAGEVADEARVAEDAEAGRGEVDALPHRRLDRRGHLVVEARDARAIASNGGIAASVSHST